MLVVGSADVAVPNGPRCSRPVPPCLPLALSAIGAAVPGAAVT
jgi:hypothetical protein